MFAISLDGQVLSPCHKAPQLCSCLSSSAARVWRALGSWERKAALSVSNLQGAKMIKHCILIESLSCQTPKAQTAERIHKGPLSMDSLRRQQSQDSHAHTHTHTPAPVCTPKLLLLTLCWSLTPSKRSWCFKAAGMQAAATFLAVKVTHI